MEQIFISHSSKDKKVVEYIIDLLENMGVASEKIFCTSVEGYGIPLGENFLETIKQEFNEKVLALFILTRNFYSSPICLCEMGAAWVKTNVHIPILVPPLTFDDVKGVIAPIQGLTINDKEKLNSLYSRILELFNIDTFNSNRWERKRNKFIDEVNSLIQYEIEDQSAACSEIGAESVDYTHYKTILDQKEKEIKILNRKLMQLELFVNKEQVLNIWEKYSSDSEKFDGIIKDVRDKLNKLPWIVRKGLYYHFSGSKLNLKDRDELKHQALDAAEDDYLIIDGDWVFLNLRDPQVKKAVESLNGLKYFLENASNEFHKSFEEVHEMCAKIESRKFWKLMELI